MTFESLYHGTDARILAMTAEEKDDRKRILLFTCFGKTADTQTERLAYIDKLK